MRRARKPKDSAIDAIAKFKFKLRRFYRIFGVSRFAWHYELQSERNVALRARIVEFASTQWYGCQVIPDTIRNEWPTLLNHKKIERTHPKEGLLLKKRKKVKKLRLIHQPLLAPMPQDEIRAMDFIFDRLASGK